MAKVSSIPFSMTGDEIIDATTHGYKWFFDTARTVHWSVANGFYGEYWTDPSATVSTLNYAFNVFSSYANINFEYVGFFNTPSVAYVKGADITVAPDGTVIGNSSVWAKSFFPNYDYDYLYSGAGGDIFLNINSQANTLTSYAPGSAGFFLAIHEIGHSLGLKHPHDDGGTGRPTLSEVGLGSLNIDWATMMSYEDDLNWNWTEYDPATPMLLDVIALQYLYGPNLGTNAGNSTHLLTVNNMYQSIWDAGGTDAVNISESLAGWCVQLPNTQLSTLVETKAGYAVLQSELTSLTLTTLYWLTGDIENVMGSHGDDLLKGSDLGNTINGGDGGDSITGNGGDDSLYGNAGSDLIYGNAGNDSIYGGQGVDSLYGGQGGDQVFGNYGDDYIYGNLADDYVYGGGGNDYMHGGAGNDTLVGGLGLDTLVGGGGNDQLIGGADADVFQFMSGHGIDIITDFSRSDGDRILLTSSLNGITTGVQALLSLSTNAQGDAMLDLGGGNIVTLTGVAPSSLQEGDFVFG